MRYVVHYINTDNAEYSEILGIFESKKDAIDCLIKKAGYEQDKNGKLVQYREPTTDFDGSYKKLKKYVTDNMKLWDIDFYKIQVNYF